MRNLIADGVRGYYIKEEVSIASRIKRTCRMAMKAAAITAPVLAILVSAADIARLSQSKAHLNDAAGAAIAIAADAKARNPYLSHQAITSLAEDYLKAYLPPGHGVRVEDFALEADQTDSALHLRVAGNVQPAILRLIAGGAAPVKIKAEAKIAFNSAS